MRITTEEKTATRKRILDAARTLFRRKGFEQATIRDIAGEVGIATGTLFNYFASKEAVVVELASQGFGRAAQEFARNRREGCRIEEDLFALIATQLRALRTIRPFVRPLLDTALHPATMSRAGETGPLLRADLSEQFSRILTDHGIDEPSAVMLNIFWSLYVGVLTFWSGDKSPKQEDTLALLDQSLRMYADWLPS